MLTSIGYVGMPVVGVDIEKLAEVVSALVAENNSLCGAIIDAVGERSVATMKLNGEIIVEISSGRVIRPLSRNYVSARMTGYFFYLYFF